MTSVSPVPHFSLGSRPTPGPMLEFAQRTSFLSGGGSVEVSSWLQVASFRGWGREEGQPVAPQGSLLGSTASVPLVRPPPSAPLSGPGWLCCEHTSAAGGVRPRPAGRQERPPVGCPAGAAASAAADGQVSRVTCTLSSGSNVEGSSDPSGLRTHWRLTELTGSFVLRDLVSL